MNINRILKNKKLVVIILLLFLGITFRIVELKIENKKIKLDDVILKGNPETNNMFAMYKKVGDEYVPYTESDSWPTGYKLNAEKSGCMDKLGNLIENVLTIENNTISLSTNKSVYCYLYFDEDRSLASLIKNNELSTEYKGEGWVGDTNPYFTNHIYHWYATDTTSANTVKDSWNVVFGGYCWQMIRTTESGGVKLLYNGEPIVGTDSETGEPTYDCSDANRRNITHVGIAEVRASQSGFSSSKTWKYGSGYTVSGSTITLTDTIDSTWSETNYNNNQLKGKYTCKNNTGTCTAMYLIDDYNTTTSAYAFPMTAGIQYNMIGNSPFNISSNSPAYVGYMYNDNTAYVSKNMALQYSSIGTKTNLYTRQTFNDNTYFSDTVPTWNSTNNNYNSLTSPTMASALKTQEGCSDYSCLVGKYTYNSTGTGIGSEVYYVVAVDSTNKYMYVRHASKGGIPSNANHTNYVIGTSITDNLDGTYTISSTNNYDVTNWSASALSPAPSASQYYYMCADGVSTTCSYGEMRFIYSNSATYFNVYLLNANSTYGTYKTGTQVTDNGNGTYTLGGTTSDIVAINWYQQYSNANNKYMCLNGELTCTDIYYVTSGSNNYFEYYSPATNYKLTNSISYSGGTYTLDMSDENSIETWNDFYTSESGIPTFTTLPSKVAKAHYVCLDSSNNLLPNTTSCSKVGYIYSLGTTAIFMPLSNGEYISTDTSSTSGMTKWADNNNLLYRMLYADNVNTKDSNAKQAIDTWYKQNILGKPFETKIDTKEIYCGDRSTSNNFGSWNSNASNMTTSIELSGLGSKTVNINGSDAPVYNLSCPNKTDAYSKDVTTKGNGDLTYPVGLISQPEMGNLGRFGYVLTYTKTNMDYYWLGSPSYLANTTTYEYSVSNTGSIAQRAVYNFVVNGLRPSIALTSDAEFTRGDGSMLNPYVVDET